MSAVFLRILEMSISASWLILAILIVRPLISKLPRWGAVALWGLVGLRLLVPFSIESSFSLIPMEKAGSQTIISGPVSAVPEAAAPASAEPDFLTVLALVWLVGVLVMAVHFLVRYGRVLRRFRTAVRLRENIYQSEGVPAPMVVGILKPRICIPFGLDNGALGPVIAHEQTHIRRGDHLWKLIGYSTLSLYWFNPFVWIAYMLLGRDIEFACDEAVIRHLDSSSRADYMQALLSFSAKPCSPFASALGFGEVGVKVRLQALANYRKPSFLCRILLAAVIVVLSVCFLTDPVKAVVKAPAPDIPAVLPEETTTPTIDPTSAAAKLQEYRAEYEELRAELEKKKEQLAFYQENLDRDLKAYFQTEEKYQDAYVMSIAFYRSMVKDLSNSIIHLENLLSEME